MKTLRLLALSAIAATSASAEETRQLDAHVHGTGQLDIAFDGQQIAMEFHAPGADIVGFEYLPESAEDRAAVENAVATLARPMDLFTISEAAGCSVIQANAGLETEEDDHEDHDHDEHAHDDHGDKDEHAHAHDEHAHEEHADEATHTEFHAEYLLNCADPAAVSEITFAYFDVFPNALEVEVQIISDAGATAYEVERDAPKLDLRGLF